MPFETRSIVAQVHERLLTMIESSELVTGSKIPSERSLATELGVSRPTLREAMRLLENEGRIIRHAGLGTFVGSEPLSRSAIDTGLEQLISYTEMMEQSGHTPGSAVLGTDVRPSSAVESDALRLDEGDLVSVLRRIRLLDGTPASYSEHIIPSELVGEISEGDGEGSVFAFVEQRSGLTLAHARTEVIPVQGSAEISSHLGLESGSILLLLDEVIFDSDQRPLILARSHFRPDLHHYHIVRTRPALDRR